MTNDVLALALATLGNLVALFVAGLRITGLSNRVFRLEEKVTKLEARNPRQNQ